MKIHIDPEWLTKLRQWEQFIQNQNHIKKIIAELYAIPNTRKVRWT